MDGELARPEGLWLLAAVAVLAAWAWWPRRTVRPLLRVPALGPPRGPAGWRARTRFLPMAGRLACLALVALALARPRTTDVRQSVRAEGIDIVVVVDTSGSMLAEDMAVDGRRASRIAAARDVVADFVARRGADRIGLVSFDDLAILRCPPTLDRGVLLDLLARVDAADPTKRTAIGTALASAVNRLKDSDAKSRVVVLVTDGRSNAGKIEPLDAAELARVMGIRVHSIGVGSRDAAPIPVRDAFGGTEYRRIVADIDEDTMRGIAKVTGGEYFRASNRGELDAIFELLDRMEKTEVEVENHVTHREGFPILARAAAVVLAAALLGGVSLWRTFP